MASLITYSKLQLIQRARQHMVDNFPSAEFGASENEVLLYVDEALAFNMVGQIWQMAKIEGNMATPEAYLTTYLLPALQQDNITQEWYSTLPQPPVNLPLGYSIDYVYFADSVYGKGKSVYPIKQNRVAFRENMVMPFGVRYWVEGSKIILVASDGSSLLNQNCYARMATTRTSSLTDTMNLPDDAIEIIFTKVIGRLKDRMQIPKDIIQDDIPAGNKAS